MAFFIFQKFDNVSGARYEHEAQVSQRGRATLRVVENFAKLLNVTVE